MVPGISSFTFGWSMEINPVKGISFMNEMDLLGIALDHKVACIQIGDNLPLHTMDIGRLTGLRQAILDQDIRLEIGARGLTPAHLKRYINLAKFMRSPMVRFVVDDEGYAPGAEEIIRVIRDALPDLEAQDIYLGIENHDRLKARELAHIITSIDHDHVGVCLDCVNSMGAGEGLEQVLHQLARHTINLHYKDYHVKRLPHKMGFIVEGTPPGEGFLNVDLLLEKITRHDRCQSVILEQWVPPETNWEDTVKKEREWALQGIRLLKGVKY